MICKATTRGQQKRKNERVCSETLENLFGGLKGTQKTAFRKQEKDEQFKRQIVSEVFVLFVSPPA